LGYVAVFNPEPKNGRHDAMCVLDLDPTSPTYSQIVGRTEMPGVGDELHHFGWNACSAALCPYSPPHPHVERRYLMVPSLRSSRIHILDTKPDRLAPKIVKVIEAKEIAARAESWRFEYNTRRTPFRARLSAAGAARSHACGRRPSMEKSLMKSGLAQNCKNLGYARVVY
jgi:selenium-binding protein 1